MLRGRSYSPKCAVRIFTKEGRMIDITDRFLKSFNTDISLDGNGGRWDISVTAGLLNNLTLMDLIEPMDYVEIYAARIPSAGGGLALVMRGFVDNIRESIDASGRWLININGRDMAKLLTQFKIYYLTELDPAASLVPQARLEINYDIPGGIISPTQFVNLIFEKIVTPNIDVLRTTNSVIPRIITKINVPDQFAVNGFTIQPFTGSISNLLDQYASKPWIESFIEDRAEGPIFNYRWSPIKSYKGEQLTNYAPPITTTFVNSADIESISVGRSDNEVVNYFFTYPTYSYLDKNNFKGEGLDLQFNPFLDEESIKRFGYRPLEVQTPLIPSLTSQSDPTGANGKPMQIALASELNQWLVKANIDNHLFKNGTITLKGGGDLRIGHELALYDRYEVYYIAGIQHSFSVEQGSHRTTVQVTRGRPLNNPAGSGGAGNTPLQAV